MPTGALTSKEIGFLLKVPLENKEIPIHAVGGGEVSLLGAVIRSAMSDWLKYRTSPDPRARKIAEEARQWILSEERGYSTFETYCSMMGSEPEIIRRQICTQAIRIGCRSKDVLSRGRTKYS